MLRREPLLFQALDLWIYGPKFLLKGKVGSCKCCQREDRATSKHLRGPEKLCLSCHMFVVVRNGSGEWEWGGEGRRSKVHGVRACTPGYLWLIYCFWAFVRHVLDKSRPIPRFF